MPSGVATTFARTKSGWISPTGSPLRRVQRVDLRPQRVERRTFDVGNAGRGVIGPRPVPFVDRQVQAYRVPPGEPVPVPVGIRFYLKAERRVMSQRAPQIAHGEDRAEAAEPAARRDLIVHKASLEKAVPGQSRPRKVTVQLKLYKF
jgi:hypothetical protein